MASLNKALLIGNLTRDPELRYVPSGAAVASFTMAMNRVYKLQTGEKKEETSFVRVVVWGRMAEVCGGSCRDHGAAPPRTNSSTTASMAQNVVIPPMPAAITNSRRESFSMPNSVENSWLKSNFS